MRIVIYSPSNVHSLELAGLMDVFADANAHAAETFYDVNIVAEHDSPIRCGSELRVLPDSAYLAIVDTPDTLPVAGSVGVPDTRGKGVIDWLILMARRDGGQFATRSPRPRGPARSNTSAASATRLTVAPLGKGALAVGNVDDGEANAYCGT